MIAILKGVFGVFFTAVVSAVFAVSFAAILYQGELSQFLDRAIGLTLLGAVVIASVGAFTLSFRGSILAPQDVPAILLAGAGASIVATGQLEGDALFATVAMLVALATFVTGIVSYFVGSLKLAFIARFLPYPVLAGFLAATGLLLLIGGLNVGLGEGIDLGRLAEYFEPSQLIKWVPVLIAAVAMFLATRIFSSEFVLPITLTLVTIGFYAFFWALGWSLQEAQEAGLFLSQSTNQGFFDGLSPSLLEAVDWQTILLQTPVILTIVATCLLGATLNASGLELEFKQDFEINQEAKGAGIANMASGICGGMPGYHIVAESILANRLGLVGAVAGLSSAAGCAAVLLIGADVLSGLPIGLFATVLAFLGLDLLYAWIWEQREKLDLKDFLIVLLIPLIAVIFSFLTAIAVGVCIACGLFIISYSKLEIVGAETNLSKKRSRVERPEEELQVLSAFGEATRILSLRGFLFFGSAHRLRERVKAILREVQTIETLVIDFRSVSGVDVSTIQMIERISADCYERDVSIVLTGLSDAAADQVSRLSDADKIELFSSLDLALEKIEAGNLARHAQDLSQGAGRIGPILDRLNTEGLLESLDLAVGDFLVRQGNESTDMYYLQSGGLTVSIPLAGGGTSTVAQILPGSIIGEMAYYTGQARSADISASEPSLVVRIDMKKLADLSDSDPALVASFHSTIAQSMALRLNRTTKLLGDLDI